MPAADRPAVAFFDVDNTVIRGASAYHLARELYRRRFFTAWDILWFGAHAFAYFLFGENNVRIQKVRRRALDIIAGRTEAEMISIGEDVYDQVLGSRVFPGARALIGAHLAAGHEVWLVTATPREIGDLIARRLGATGAVGTVAESRDGIYTGRLVGDMMHGEHKADAVREIASRAGVELEDCSAYGDSINDVPMLSIVGHPCAINPDPRLRLHCAGTGWPVRDFRRRRRSVKRGVTTASWAGAAWAAAVVARAIHRRLFGRRP
ncbi:HAD-superfamily subfamily IB hydrolase, TIGR01490 [Beutenbergia cavernae DSM 12333]|uniref:HAD-superfamily subfamily IB hydrolase, TIGR01490 n=1 Tax=Beutenbergia cavernae (strain ATCC BAA-8 / DSM 12333 / CCUG 43141 / JCM 11478 / NBRC 16432 / NCIMB 13614 / HKI 0122) TaxID=471853 RepID=C5C192_BEUC1|nr:HAD-superfamily subfamily IB hydrolase, TIGR01490 [Beutenbergia cavernae DSM 12333]